MVCGRSLTLASMCFLFYIDDNIGAVFSLVVQNRFGFLTVYRFELESNYEKKKT